MSSATERERWLVAGLGLRAPLGVLFLSLVLVAVLSLLPLVVPIGSAYWDLYLYFDGANRIFDGQVPIVDFFAPVGPLSYYLFAGAVALFPDAQPALLVHWSMLAVTAPLMALIVAHVDAKSRASAFALLIPFLVFALLPFNTRDFYPYPGSDGFGMYNRQGAQLLYVLVAAVLLVKDQRRLASIVAIAMLAMFLLKITAFIAGLLICAYAFAAGRIAFRPAAASALAFFGVLALLEFTDGMVSGYFRDILELVAMNEDVLASRFLRAASLNFGALAPGGALVLVLLFAGRDRLRKASANLLAKPSLSSVPAVLDNHALWLAVVLFAGWFYETQNTGSQAMIMVWPVLWAVLLRVPSMFATPRLLAATVTLAGMVALPLLVNTVERAARTYVGSVNNVPLEHRHLKTMGAVSMRPELAGRTDRLIEMYSRHPDMFREFVDIGEMPSQILTWDLDFQITYLKAIDEAIEAILKLEKEKGVRFETMMTLSFTNAFPWLMDRHAPRHISIGADISRTVPPPGSREGEAIRDVDLALYPTCPEMVAADKLRALYAPYLAEHRPVRLGRCYVGYVNPRLAGKMAGN
ncbi:hypothetical protein [Aquamicrobium sp. LC103]|uniref:hypothetical protein n=1 Tax=Aquamicrobium sp. LC103 TaxID=1120658 RepID=UPI00063ECDCA|nr:hypothetical protein [Aquamicrobium sp. LC103]TKT80058.1 hypothetical protein XW59_006785 [Aquamicrobium sp. LC103]